MKLLGSVTLPALVVFQQVLRPITYGKDGEIPISGTYKEIRVGEQRELNKGREIFIPLMSHQEKSLQHAQRAS